MRRDCKSKPADLPSLKVTLELQWKLESYSNFRNTFACLGGWSADALLLQTIELGSTDVSIVYSVLPYAVLQVSEALRDSKTQKYLGQLGIELIASDEFEKIVESQEAWLHSTQEKAKDLIKISDRQLSAVTQGSSQRRPNPDGATADITSSSDEEMPNNSRTTRSNMPTFTGHRHDGHQEEFTPGYSSKNVSQNGNKLNDRPRSNPNPIDFLKPTPRPTPKPRQRARVDSNLTSLPDKIHPSITNPEKNSWSRSNGSGGKPEENQQINKPKLSTSCGYELSMFTGNPPENLICAVCRLVMREPHMMGCCQRVMCKTCVQSSKADVICPICKDDDHDIMLNKKALRTIMSLNVECPMNECQWKGELKDLESHVHEISQKRKASQQKIPSCPHRVHVTEIDDDSVTLVWKEPEENAASVEEYAIFYCDIDDDIDNWMEYSEKVTSESIVVENLPPGTYAFKVKAIFDGGSQCTKLSKATKTVKLEEFFQPPAVTKVSPRFSNPEVDSYSSSRFSKPENNTSSRHSNPEIRGYSSSREGKSKSQSLSFVGPPSQPVIRSFSANDVVLQWDAPEFHADKLNQYIVSIQKDSDDDFELIETYSIETVYKMENLTPKTNYIFQVFAESLSGTKSAPSESVFCRTKCAMPGRPGKPEADNIKTKSLRLSWQKPQRNSENVDSYKISCYQLQSGEMNKFEELVIDEESCVIKNLRPQSEYIFGVRAISSKRETDEVSSDTIKTACQVSGPPDCLEIGNVESTQVQLNWKPPLHNPEAVKKYVIQYCLLHDEDSVWEDVSSVASNVTSQTIDDLSEGVGYVFRVAARCAGRHGNISEWTESQPIHTKRKVLMGPGKPYCESEPLSDTIEIAWEKPKKYGNKVKQYEVVCVDTATNDEVCRKYSDECHITFDNLTSGTEYYFYVKAHVSNGQVSRPSLFSDSISTANPLPNINGKPEAKQVTTSSIKLKWQPACSLNEVSKYKIVYRPADSRRHWEHKETDDNSTEYTINELFPDTSYVFKIIAKSRQYKEYGPESQPLTVKTTPLPCGKPTLTTTSTNSISLRWTPPRKGAARVTHYEILFISEASNEWGRYPDMFHKPEGIIQRLESGKRYCFIVRTYFQGNDDGYSDSERSEWFRTKYPIPSPPGKPLAVSIGQDCVLLNWAKPLHNHEFLDHYNICIVQGNRKKQVFSNITEEAFPIKKLNPNTEYQFVVEAVSIDGTTVDSEGYVVTTEKELPGAPGRPYMLRVTDSSVRLAWEQPKTSAELVNKYIVYYKGSFDRDWKHEEIKSKDTSYEVTGLRHSTSYEFMVSSVTKTGERGKDSEVSEPVSTKSSLPSAPGKPKGKTISPTSIELKWDRPQKNFHCIAYYEVSYYEDGQSDNHRTNQVERTAGPMEYLTIKNMPSKNKGYYFYVTAVTTDGVQSESSGVSDLVTKEVSLAEKFIPECTKIADESSVIPVYLLPKEDVGGETQQNGLNKFEIALSKQKASTASAFSKFGLGVKNKLSARPKHKVLMLVGATGSGKSTLVNGMVNYIMRVDYHDHFRLKLIHDPNVSQTESVTSAVSAYTIHHEQGFALPYTFTIIDTPGFGDTKGIEHDKKITAQIKKFFNMRGGIQHLDGVGFVCQAGQVRLTPTQRYIFDSIFAMFGNDVKGNIFVLCTFSDDNQPQVIKAVEEAKIPAHNFYQFNNTALYSSTGKMGELFWDMGAESFKKFFSKFETTASVSLTLTKEVLKQREQLETIVIGLQERIQSGMSLIESLRKERKFLDEKKDIIEQNKNIQYTVEEDRIVKVKITDGRYTTNCVKCNMTCHYPCIYSDDDKKMNCAAMSENAGSKDATCGVCPGRCHWSGHKNMSFIMKTEKHKVQKEYKEMMLKYQKASSEKITVEGVIRGLESDIDEKFQEVLSMVMEANRCTKKLDEIAFRPNHLDNSQYIQLLIDAQEQEKKPGYTERVKHYRVLQKQADLLAKTGRYSKKGQESGKRWWLDEFMNS